MPLGVICAEIQTFVPLTHIVSFAETTELHSELQVASACWAQFATLHILTYKKKCLVVLQLERKGCSNQGSNDINECNYRC